MLKSKTVFLLLFLCLILCACKKEDDVSVGADLLYVQDGGSDAGYRFSAVEQKDYIIEKQGVASLVYPMTEALSFDKEGARFEEVLVRKGDKVTKGQVLATFLIESDQVAMEELALALDRTEQEYGREKGKKLYEITSAEEKLTEISGLSEKEIAEKRIEILKMQYEKYCYQTEKQMETLKDRIEEIKEKQAQNCLTAPFDGIVSSVRSYNVGDKVTAGAEILTVYSPERVLLTVKNENNQFRYNMPVSLEVGNGNNRSVFQGRVVTAPEVMPEGEVLHNVLIVLDEEVKASELSGNIRYQCNTIEIRDVLVADNQTISWEEQTAYVYIYENGKLCKRAVKVGMNNSKEAWILDGVTEGKSLVLN